MRNVVLHYHMFKNAGTSIDACLADSFGDAWHNFDRDEEWTNLTTADLYEHLTENPHLLALSSHQARWPEPWREDLRVHPIVLVRHPIDRVGSLHSFATRRGEPEAKGTTLAQYVDRVLEPEAGFVARSFQTLFLSDDEHLTQWPEGPTTEASGTHLNQAMARLEQLPTFGMVERFDETIALLGHQLAPHFPDLALVVRHENVSPGRDPVLADRIDQIRSALGRRRYRRLLDANEFDMELWSRAERMFDQKSAQLLRQSC